ncbi:hypothetical protein N7497_008129 [Penicillium chrysogenum]|nr:hypothetical protein N7497_008129 [Penicillium chrysogenum]
MKRKDTGSTRVDQPNKTQEMKKNNDPKTNPQPGARISPFFLNQEGYHRATGNHRSLRNHPTLILSDKTSISTLSVSNLLLVLSRPSPYFAYDRATLGSTCEGCEVGELRLSEPGDDGAEEPGVSADTAVGFAVALAAAAAAAGLQCAQTKMLKPRPLQLRQIAPLEWFSMEMEVERLFGGVYTSGHSLRNPCM